MRELGGINPPELGFLFIFPAQRHVVVTLAFFFPVSGKKKKKGLFRKNSFKNDFFPSKILKVGTMANWVSDLKSGRPFQMSNKNNR